MAITRSHVISSSLRVQSDVTGWVLGVLSALAFGYVVLTPTLNVLPFISLYDSKRILELGVLLAAGVCVVAVPGLRTNWLALFAQIPLVARLGLGLMLVLGVVSALFAPVPRFALLDVSHYVLLFLFGGVIAVTYQQFGVAFERAFAGVLALSVFFYAVHFSVGYAVHLFESEVPLWPGGDIGFANKRFFNQFQSWSLPLLVLPVLFVPPRYRWARGGLLALVAFWWMLLFASGGRGTVLGMIVALAGTAMLFRRRAWPWLRAQLASLGAGLVGYLLLFKVLNSTGASIAERGTRSGGRFEDWQAALSLVAKEPVLGIGPMHTAYFPNGLWPTTHNALLQFVTEWGIPAGLILLVLAGWGFTAWVQQHRAVVQRYNGRRLFLSVAVTGSLLAAGTHALLSGVIVMPLSQVMMALVLGWSWALFIDANQQAVRKKSGTLSHWVLGAFCLASIGLALWACYPEALHTGAMKIGWVMETKQFGFSPRYWHQGVFGY